MLQENFRSKSSRRKNWVPVTPIFIPTEEFNKLVVAKAPVQTLRQQAAKEGAVSLKMDGLMKAMAGMATLEDVLNSL